MSAASWRSFFLIGLVGLTSIVGFGLLWLGLAGFALWYGWTYDPRPKGSREPMSFRVTPNSIETDGRTFMKSDIHRLILKNAITEQELGVEVYTTSSGYAAGRAFRAANAKNANTLNVESDGKSTIIAGGMDETTAYGLLRDVCQILDFKVN